MQEESEQEPKWLLLCDCYILLSHALQGALLVWPRQQLTLHTIKWFVLELIAGARTHCRMYRRQCAQSRCNRQIMMWWRHMEWEWRWCWWYCGIAAYIYSASHWMPSAHLSASVSDSRHRPTAVSTHTTTRFTQRSRVTCHNRLTLINPMQSSSAMHPVRAPAIRR